MPGSRPSPATAGGAVLFRAQRTRPLDDPGRLPALDGVTGVWVSAPVFHVRGGESLFESGTEMLEEAEARGESLGRVTLAYESGILGLSEDEVLEETLRRLAIMERSAHFGLDDRKVDMLLLEPTASRVVRAESQGKLPVGGLHTRAAARAPGRRRRHLAPEHHRLAVRPGGRDL